MCPARLVVLAHIGACRRYIKYGTQVLGVPFNPVLIHLYTAQPQPCPKCENLSECPAHARFYTSVTASGELGDPSECLSSRRRDIHTPRRCHRTCIEPPPTPMHTPSFLSHIPGRKSHFPVTGGTHTTTNQTTTKTLGPCGRGRTYRIWSILECRDPSCPLLGNI